MAPEAESSARGNITLDSLRLPAFAAPKSGPVIIAIEGPNGAGKTTLSWELSRKLGVPWYLGTDEAWSAENLKVRMIRDADWYASAMFFLSGCFEQGRVLRERPERLVVMDRSLWSTLAVHGATDPERLRALLEMLRPLAQELGVPHMTLVLEASFAACQSRIANKTGSARALDQLTATAEFHAREAAFYRWLGGQSDRVAFLNANARVEQVVDGALAIIQAKFGALVSS
ncbi:MAG TPA: AAA family ATPase [Verrucomicrobiae bacterium]|nr:AAA family ATPase [Verrucomicrobiae bacterium]